MANGRSDVVFDMTNQTDEPSYGWQLEKGMTSLAETWDVQVQTSMNHCMLGHIEEWFYHDLAGIQVDLSSIGTQRLQIRPAIVGNLTWVEASYDSIIGRIESSWKRNGDVIAMDVTIPANVTATVYVPTSHPANVQEGGRPATEAQSVKLLRHEPGVAVFEVGSGTYQFVNNLDTNSGTTGQLPK